MRLHPPAPRLQPPVLRLQAEDRRLQAEDRRLQAVACALHHGYLLCTDLTQFTLHAHCDCVVGFHPYSFVSSPSLWEGRGRSFSCDCTAVGFLRLILIILRGGRRETPMSFLAACGPYVFVLAARKNMSLCPYVFKTKTRKHVLMSLCL